MPRRVAKVDLAAALLAERAAATGKIAVTDVRSCARDYGVNYANLLLALNRIVREKGAPAGVIGTLTQEHQRMIFQGSHALEVAQLAESGRLTPSLLDRKAAAAGVNKQRLLLLAKSMANRFGAPGALAALRSETSLITPTRMLVKKSMTGGLSPLAVLLAAKQCGLDPEKLAGKVMEEARQRKAEQGVLESIGRSASLIKENRVAAQQLMEMFPQKRAVKLIDSVRALGRIMLNNPRPQAIGVLARRAGTNSLELLDLAWKIAAFEGNDALATAIHEWRSRRPAKMMGA
ncbi:hypothetical protein HYS54_03295 [Candidatus Micrarchaeota archaeon]|nr:hypothetical protein [Candidatus Micrarchaeota archaeon]